MVVANGESTYLQNVKQTVVDFNNSLLDGTTDEDAALSTMASGFHIH